MSKKINRIYNICFIALATLIFSGCGGGGGTLGSLGGGGGFPPGDGGGGGSAVINPEPSTLMLLGSGLIGMAIYARARLKRKK